MPTIATAMLVLGVLATAAGILVWYTAVTTADTHNVLWGRRIAAAGRWTTGPGILLWLGGEHPAGTPMQALMIAATFAAAMSLSTKTTYTPRTPQPA